MVAFKRIRDGLAYILTALHNFESEWPYYDPDAAAHQLTVSTILLEGLLDGLIILGKDKPSSSMSFYKTDLTNPDILSIQQHMRGLRSHHPLSTTHADFWTIADFWKHYFPYMMLPTRVVSSTNGNLMLADYIIMLGEGDNCKSGPIVNDIIVPMFNSTRQLLLKTNIMMGASEEIPACL